MSAGTKPRPTFGTGRIMQLLRAKYQAPSYAFFAEVADSTGGPASRSADAIAMGLWPSRGLTLTGFEVKASRSDWIRELESPAKAELICRFCDYWYLVIGDETIVREGELPPTWGLIAPRGDDLAVKVQAPKLEPLPVTRGFLAALCRRATEQSVDFEMLKEARLAGVKEGRVMGERDAHGSRADHDRLRKAVADFEKASGIQLGDGWAGGERIGEAVRFVLDGGYKRYSTNLTGLKTAAENIARAIGVEMARVEGEA